jgi:hypothetical protein
MFMHFTIHGIKAWEVQDHPWDPLNTEVELYQTWHLAELEPVDASPKANWARQGFSVRGAPDSGTSYSEGQTRIVTDPQITFGLGEHVFKAGARSCFRLDFHHWESDDGDATEKVRAAFTDNTLKQLVGAWSAAKGDSVRVRAKLEDWIKNNYKNTLKSGIAAAGAATSPWVAAGMDLLPAIELLVDVLKNQGDNFFDMHRFIIAIDGTGDEKAVKWRVTPPNGVAPAWTTGQGKQDFAVRIENANGKNKLDARYVFRMID